MLDSDLVEQSGDLHGSAYLVQEMDRDPVYRKNLAFLRSVRGEEKLRYLSERVPDGLSKDDVEEYFTLLVRVTQRAAMVTPVWLAALA